jgi:hypothetical protein
MAVIDYKDVAIVANTLGIEGDYTSLEAKFRDMNDQGFVNIYQKLRERLSAPETSKCIDTILQLTGFTISEEVANALLTDKYLVKFLNDKRVKKGELVRILRDYKTNGIQKKAKEIKKNPEDKIYTYYRFVIETVDGEQSAILIPEKKYNTLRNNITNGKKEELSNFLKRYGISPSSIKKSKIEPWKLTWLERSKILHNIKKGILGPFETRFLEEGNFNYTLISKKELRRGITASHLEKIFGLEEGSLRKDNEDDTPIQLDLSITCYRTTPTIDLGIQKMFMGENISIFTVFSIRNLSYYVVDIPLNDYVSYDHTTGTLIPVKEGSVEMTLTSNTNGVVKKITLSVGPSQKQSLHAYLHKKKMELTPQEDKKDSQ